MKKIISLFLVLAMAIALTACTGDTVTASTEPTPSTTSAYTTEKTEDEPSLPLAAPNSLVFHLDFATENFKDVKYTDVTGNGHDGIVHGNVENEDGCARFIGSPADYISIEDHPDLNFKSKQSFTLEIRFKADPQAARGCIAQKGFCDKRPSYYGFWIDEANKASLGISRSSMKSYPSDAPVGTEWHRIILIQDSKAGTVLFYLDGELQASTFPKTTVPAANCTVTSTGEDFTIGTNSIDHFAGLIDYIKLYNYAVPEKELLSDFQHNVFTLDRKYYEYTDTEENKSFTLPYRIYYPTGYEESDGTKYPVVLMLHGHGECGKNNVGHLRNNGGHIEGLMARDDCIVIAPQCLCDGGLNTEWVASKHNFDYTNRTLDEKGTIALRALMDLMDEIAKDPKVDTNKISAFGFSMGGFGVWELLMRKPDMFSAAVIFSAAGAPASADKVLDIDIRAYHGMKDTTVPYSGLTLMDKAITALGGTKFSASYFENAEHNSCAGHAFSQDGDLFAWLLEQTKAD
ncbi:MAG: dienelactone hydrolase family protein [Clostridia bacterium]|nr:dienelactone hydrolase family protein [Clostridia bacterium]